MDNKYTGGWSKYGGARHGAIKESFDDSWFCQSCGSMQPHTLKPFLYEFLPGEYVRVCAKCLQDECKELWAQRTR